MKRKHILTIILASFFVIVAFHGIDAYAQTSISGDTLCGSTSATKCGVKDLAIIFKKIFGTIIALGLPLLVIFIMYRFVVAWWQLEQGNANAYKEAISKVTQAIIGFIIIVALFGGIFMAMLKYLGVKDFPLELLKSISSEMTITRAYAAPVPKGACPQNFGKQYSCITDTDKDGYCSNKFCLDLRKSSGNAISSALCGAAMEGYLCKNSKNEEGVCMPGECVIFSPAPEPTPVVTATPTPATVTPAPTPTPAPAPTPTSCGTAGLPNPLGVCSLYDFILNALKLVLKFFIYPALIAMWVWTGFNYVLAQGAPEKLMKTHRLLMWAVISTLVVFVVQGFLVALRGSVEKIVPSTSMVIPVSKLSIDENIKIINKII